jgi:hypothetical protein
MDAPTLEQVRARSEVISGRFASPGGDVALQTLVDDAVAYVAAVTGRAIGLIAGEAVPDGLVPIAVRAVTLATEGFAVGGALDIRESSASGEPVLASLTAGPYAESYFAPGSERTAESLLSPDRALARLLWLLLTDAKRAALLRLLDPGAFPEEAAWGVMEVDFFPESIDPDVAGWR